MTSTPARQKLFYRVDEVAEMLDVSVRTVYRKVAEGVIPSVQLRGTVRIPVQEFHTRFRLETTHPQ